MNYPHTITLRRLQASGSQYIYADSGTITAFVQPMDTESSELLHEGFTKGSFAYVPFATDIRENDEVIFNGVKYGVKGVKSYQFGNLTHKKVLLEEST